MSSNKNNSMEKRIVKELERERKRYAYVVLCEIFYTTITQNKGYLIPRFMVEGMYNKQKIQKLANTIIKENEDKGRKLTEKEEILSACKEYWNNEIMNVYKAVNEIEVKDINVK